MSILKKLFGGGQAAKPAAEPVSYNGFTITPEPIKEGAEYRVSAVIEKDGRTHRLIRADTLNDPAAAAEASVGKAKVMIDQMGDAIFG